MRIPELQNNFQPSSTVISGSIDSLKTAGDLFEMAGISGVQLLGSPESNSHIELV